MAATAAEIRRQNVFDVMRSVHNAAKATRKSIANETGLSVATVSSVIAELQARGIVRETTLSRQYTGRPSSQLALNPDHGVFLGVDIAETYVHVEAYDSALTSLSSTEVPLDPERRDPATVIGAVSEVILSEIAGLGNSQVLGIGVSAPGQIDPAGGTSVFAPNWNWHRVPLLESLRETIQSPLSLDNPLKLLTVAELWSSSGREVEDFAVINIGTGVGAGICIDRQVFRGRSNSAGELGHCVLVAGGRDCRCGSRGCIEAYTGAPGMIQTVRDHAPHLLGPSLSQAEAVAAFAAAIKAGDRSALETLDIVARHLGMAISTLINLLNPGHVVLSGWVTRCLGPALMDAALPYVRKHALAVPFTGTTFAVQKIDGNAVSLGAAYAAVEAYLDSTNKATALFPPTPKHG
jgi:predicted NBD/HSP70 family sugar kinase